MGFLTARESATILRMSFEIDETPLEFAQVDRAARVLLVSDVLAHHEDRELLVKDSAALGVHCQAWLVSAEPCQVALCLVESDIAELRALAEQALLDRLPSLF